jgi:4-hydroxybenzoate polyprenyltransferase
LIVSRVSQLSHFAADIKLSHSVFALPWAVLSAFLAADGLPRPVTIALVVICMVLARTVAMAANRLLDAAIDARNPRTAGRAIPAGRLSRGYVAGVIAVGSLGFVATCAGFGLIDRNWLPVVLALPVLLFLTAYPFLKRFTRLVHYYLGLALGLAPICAWIAVAGTLAWPPVLMGLCVTLWTAGFDILYACQDVEIDRRDGLFSVPSRLGVPRALLVARATHAVCLEGLIVLHRITPQFGVPFAVAIGIAATLLVIEHSLVRPADLSKLNLAFFTLNGVISLAIGVLGVADCFI